MTVVSEGEGIPAAAMLEVSIRDSAVVARGADEHGTKSVAVWQISEHGVPTGAQVLPHAEVSSSPDAARRLLSILERRAITARTPHQASDIVGQLTVAAKIDADRWWERHVFNPVISFREVLARRERYGATAAASRTQSGRKATPLKWTRDLSTSASTDVDALHRLSGRAVPAEGTLVAETLTVCAALRWLIELWHETEQVKNRRSYVFDAHGPPEVLPPSWLAAVHHANETRLPL